MYGWCTTITTIYKNDYVVIKKESDGTYFANVKIKSKGVDKDKEHNVRVWNITLINEEENYLKNVANNLRVIAERFYDYGISSGAEWGKQCKETEIREKVKRFLDIGD